MSTYKTLTEMHEDDLNWNNDYHIREMVRRELKGMEWTLENEYNLEETDWQDALHEQIDGHQFVIYHYEAERLARAFNVSPFDESELTGERYENWNVIAYEILYNEFMEKYGEGFYNTYE